MAALPEYYYVLGFSPQNLKFDGSYHNLKVSLKSPAGLDAAGAPRIYTLPSTKWMPLRKPSARSKKRYSPATNGTTFPWNCIRSFSNPAMWPQSCPFWRASMSDSSVFEKRMDEIWTC